jgi:hypothetical protein
VTGELELRALPSIVQELIGCAWGRKLASPDDAEPCDEQAVRIIVLHHDGEELEVRLCGRHADAVVELTDPHEEES